MRIWRLPQLLVTFELILAFNEDGYIGNLEKKSSCEIHHLLYPAQWRTTIYAVCHWVATPEHLAETWPDEEDYLEEKNVDLLNFYLFHGMFHFRTRP